MEKVAILKQHGYNLAEIKNKVEMSITSLGGFEKLFRKNSRILLKPNVLAGFAPESCVTTNPVFLQAVIEYFQENGCKVFVGDSPAITGLKGALIKTGMYDVITKTGAEVVEFKVSKSITISEEFLFKKLELASEIFEYDHIVNLPKLKTHSMMLMTLAVKNLFGCVVGKQKAGWHLKCGKDYASFANMLVEVASIVGPTLNIVDGIWGMEGNGPSAGTPVHTGVILAGENPAAVDIAICNLIGLRPEQLLTNKAAVAIKMIEDYNDIEYTFQTPFKLQVKNFDLPKTGFMEGYGLSGSDDDTTMSKIKGKVVKTILQQAENLMTTKPYVKHDECTLCQQCANICPPGIITEVNKKIVIDYEKCIRCYCCHEVCPEHAMDIQESFLKRYLNVG